MFNATTILVTALALMVSVAHAKDIDSEYEAAVALIKTKNYAAAQTLLASVIESAQKTGVKASTPMLVKAYYATGYIYEKQEASSEAISDYLAVIRLSLALRVDDPEARDKAGRAFAALERLSPGRAEVLKAAANLETAALDMDDAEKRSLISIVASMRDQVFALNPTDRVSHVGMDPDDWGMRYWTGRRWIKADLWNTEHQFRGSLLEVTNTTGIYDHAVVYFRTDLSGNYEIEVQVKGAADVRLWSADEKNKGSWAGGMPDDNWHTYRLRYFHGTSEAWVDGKAVPMPCHLCNEVRVNNFGVRVNTDKTVQLRNFRLRRL